MKLFKNKKVYFITFNYDYHNEKPIRLLSKEKKIKLLLWYKESIYTQEQLNYYHNQLQEIKNFHKIAVYNNLMKNYFIKWGRINKNKIDVIGMPRSFFSRNNVTKKNNKNNKFNILFYYFERDRGINNKTKKDIQLNNWDEIRDGVLDSLYKLAKNNSKLNISVKSKAYDLFSNFAKRVMDYNIENLNFYYEGSGHNFLKSNDIVISFNSTTTYEAMLAEKNILIPIFKKYSNIKYNKRILSVPKTIVVKSQKELETKIQYYFKHKKFNKPRLNIYHKHIVKYFGDYRKTQKLAKKVFRNKLNVWVILYFW